MRRFLLMAFTALTTSVSQAADLKLHLQGFRNGVGFVALSVFEESRKEDFPGKADNALRTFYVALDGRTELTLNVPNLREGTYAVSLLHDEDGDRKLKTALGIPREGFGFSNNPGIMIGAPSFSKAAFHFRNEDASMTIHIKYML